MTWGGPWVPGKGKRNCGWVMTGEIKGGERDRNISETKGREKQDCFTILPRANLAFITAVSLQSLMAEGSFWYKLSRPPVSHLLLHTFMYIFTNSCSLFFWKIQKGNKR